MTDKEKANEYADKILSDSNCPFIFSKEVVKAYIIKVYLDSLKCCENVYNKGLAEGRKETCEKLLEEVRTHDGMEQMTKFYISEIIKNIELAE